MSVDKVFLWPIPCSVAQALSLVGASENLPSPVLTPSSPTLEKPPGQIVRHTPERRCFFMRPSLLQFVTGSFPPDLFLDGFAMEVWLRGELDTFL